MSKKDKCFPSNSSYESEKLVRRRREGERDCEKENLPVNHRRRRRRGRRRRRRSVKGQCEMRRRRICSEKLFR